MQPASPWTRLHVFAREAAQRLGPPPSIIRWAPRHVVVSAAMRVCASRPFDDPTPAQDLFSCVLFDLGLRSFDRSAAAHIAEDIAGSQDAEAAWRLAVPPLPPPLSLPGTEVRDVQS